MKRRKQEKVTTYISTLTVNFGNNQSAKSETHSKSHNLPSKEQHVRSSTSCHSDVSQSYRQAQKSTGSYYHMVKSTPPNRSNGPELKKEAQKHSSFQSSKTYFEELSRTKSGDAGSWSKSYSSRDDKQPKYNSYSSKEVEYDKPSPPTAEKWEPYKNEVKSDASTSVSSVKTLDSPKNKASNSSASSVTKTSTGNRKSKETMTTTTTTTTTIEEKQILSSVKSTEVTSVKPETDYGETDWYLDILLRMQSLEMKQQNLHTQYDFLGKLAKENREDLKLSRDWARYNADNYEVEAY